MIVLGIFAFQMRVFSKRYVFKQQRKLWQCLRDIVESIYTRTVNKFLTASYCYFLFSDLIGCLHEKVYQNQTTGNTFFASFLSGASPVTCNFKDTCIFLTNWSRATIFVSIHMFKGSLSLLMITEFKFSQAFCRTLKGNEVLSKIKCKI